MKPALAYIRRNVKYACPPNWKAGAKALYRRLTRSGILFSQDDLGMCSMHPARKIDRILELTKPRSVLDVGCGTGKSLMDFKGRGLDVLGVEGSKVAISHSPCRNLIRQHDLRKPLHLHRSFDLVWCFEVAEHIHPKFVDVFVRNLVRHSAVIAMSAAPPGQGGEGHFNEQPQRYWEKKFANCGYFLHSEWTDALRQVEEFYSQNMMVFYRVSVKSSIPAKPPVSGGTRS